jgi:hypothetical protein
VTSTGVVPYAWTQVVNIKRDPFETSIGQQIKTLMGVGGAIAGPVTAYQYDWNMLPIGQALWLRELQSYIPFPPLQSLVTERAAREGRPLGPLNPAATSS